MKYSFILIVLITLAGCRQEKEIQENPVMTPDDSKIPILYECPEDYPKILSRLVYSRFKDDDPFVVNPDSPPKGVLIEYWPQDSIRDLGFTFMRGEYLTYIPPSQKLLVVASPKTHEKFLKFHENLDIVIVKANEQQINEQPAIRPESMPADTDRPQPESESRSR
jgi:hypothetical protein